MTNAITKRRHTPIWVDNRRREANKTAVQNPMNHPDFEVIQNALIDEGIVYREIKVITWVKPPYCPPGCRVERIKLGTWSHERRTRFVVVTV